MRQNKEQEWVDSFIIPMDSPLPSTLPKVDIKGLPQSIHEIDRITRAGCEVVEFTDTIPGDLLELFNL